MMSMTREAAEAVLVELREVADVRIRAMMGGWLVYAHEVLVGQVDDGELYVKDTAFAADFAPQVPRRPPYPGARPALVVSASRRGDAEWLHELIAGTVDALRPYRAAPADDPVASRTPCRSRAHFSRLRSLRQARNCAGGLPK